MPKQIPRFVLDCCREQHSKSSPEKPRSQSRAMSPREHSNMGAKVRQLVEGFEAKSAVCESTRKPVATMVDTRPPPSGAGIKPVWRQSSLPTYTSGQKPTVQPATSYKPRSVSCMKSRTGYSGLSALQQPGNFLFLRQSILRLPAYLASLLPFYHALLPSTELHSYR